MGTKSGALHGATQEWDPQRIVPQNSFTAAISRSISSGRDSRWSPSLIKVSTTSSRAKRDTSSTRVPPRHVRILHALQDVHRAAGLDQPAEQQMLAAVLDQPLGDRIGRFGIFRRPHPGALVLDLALDSVRELLPHQLFGEVHRRRDQHHAGDRAPPIAACAVARQQQRQPAAHRRADHHLRALGELRVDRDALLQPAADGAVIEVAARFAVAGIVEAHAGTALAFGPAIERRRPWCPSCRT